MSKIPANLAADYYRGERPTAPKPRSVSGTRLLLAILSCFALGVAIGVAFLQSQAIRSSFDTFVADYGAYGTVSCYFG